MKAIIAKAAKLAVEVQAEIEKREEYYDSRSEKWLESDAADDYDENTDRLRELSDALDEFNSNFI